MDRIQKRKRKKPQRIENLPLPTEKTLDRLAHILSRQIDREILNRKYSSIEAVLKLVGTGIFLAALAGAPNLPKAIKPFLSDTSSYHPWKRFNIPYLKRTIVRLEEQKLVEVGEEDGVQTVHITNAGRRRILKYALGTLTITKPKYWDKTWRLVSYDLPEGSSGIRNTFHRYLLSWGFYPIHESVLLHAYPCEKEIEFLREYLGIGKYVRIFVVSNVEDDEVFREFFDV